MNAIDRALYRAAQRIRHEIAPDRPLRAHTADHRVVRVGPHRICRELDCVLLVVE